MAYFVYILECSDGTLYTGSTNDVEKRVHAHNHLKSGARYTRARRPVKLAYSKKFKTPKEAKRREYQLKQLSHSQKRDIVLQSSHEPTLCTRCVRTPRVPPHGKLDPHRGALPRLR